MTRKIVALAVALVVLGATAAAAGAFWPAACSGDACVNSHLNDLNTRVSKISARLSLTDPKTVVVQDDVVFDVTDPTSVPFIEALTACGTPDPTDDRPFKGWAISGGISISGEGSEGWHMVSSGPPNMMNSWPVSAANPNWVEGDPLPTVTTFAICLAI